MSTTAPESPTRRLFRPRPLPKAASLLGMAIVALVGVWLLVNLIASPAQFLTVALIGVTYGALYGLIALGYTLVYGILELINFAHGDLFMLGGMMSATLFLSVFSIGAADPWYVVWPIILLTLVLSSAFAASLNTGIEAVAYRRLRGSPRLAPLITAVAMSFVLQGVGLLWKGPDFVRVEGLVSTDKVFDINGFSITWNKLVVILVTIPVLFALVYLVQQTRQGKAMRAVAQDQQAASMMGINVNRTISFTFALGGALAGVAGVLWLIFPGSMRYDTGFQTGLIAFTAAVLGGIGNLPGAVVGSLVIGLIQAFNEGLSIGAPGPSWTQSIVFSVLILILVFRPEGILGERTPEGQ
jgi:branched-chain amino acid transport system permease protein